jgi:GMP synthase (glutamine-hydrolysing)
MTPRVAVLTHADGTDTSWLEEGLREQGSQPGPVRLHHDEPVPDVRTLDGLVVLGGPMGAYQRERYPFLNSSARALDDAIERDVPTLAICLGAQLLAQVAGGKARPGHGLEWGYTDIQLTGAGKKDPILDVCEGEHFSFHSDTFDLPAGTELLATSQEYPQAFRVGSALAIQFHPELSPAGIARLLKRRGLGTVHDPHVVDRVMHQATDRQVGAREILRRLLQRWALPAPQRNRLT